MAAYDLEEQEQLSQIKAWWETYGNLVTGVALVAAIAAVAWQGWTWYQGKQSGEASVLYAAVQKAVAENKPQQAREAAGMLIEKYSGTAYADLGALLASRAQADAGDLKNARAQLGWAAEKANDPVLRELARLRLAAVLLDEKSYDEALAQLQAKPSDALAARYADLRGDILAAQGKPAEARTAYKAALDSLATATKPEAAAFKEVVQAKLDGLGGAQ